MSLRSSASTCGRSPFWLKILILRNITPRSSACAFSIWRKRFQRAVAIALRELDAGQNDVGAGIVGVDRERLLRRAACPVVVLQLEQNGGLERHHIGVLRVDLAGLVGELERLVERVAEEIEARQLGRGGKVVRRELGDPAQRAGEPLAGSCSCSSICASACQAGSRSALRWSALRSSMRAFT